MGWRKEEIMKSHELKTASRSDKKRVGRGISSGYGKTAGRGTKGQSSRAGGKVRPGFEGGQNPLMQRIPKKKGFTSKRVPAQVVYTDQLNKLTGTVTNQSLAENDLVETAFSPVKIVTRGEITKKVNVKTQGASKTSK